eukprot:gene1313-4039_t
MDVLGLRMEGLTVESVLSSFPAEQAGVRAGALLVAVTIPTPEDPALVQ